MNMHIFMNIFGNRSIVYSTGYSAAEGGSNL